MAQTASFHWRACAVSRRHRGRCVSFLTCAGTGGIRYGRSAHQRPLLVKVVNATSVTGVERAFTGTIAARVQSNLGFRVPGKIVERLVDVGQQVKAGQPLMRIDETDLRLALTAKRNAVIAARAVFVQARADEKRYAALVKGGLAASPQRYEQAKAALDTAEAQLEAAEAEAKVAENEATYSTLVADADGTVVSDARGTGTGRRGGTDRGAAARMPARARRSSRSPKRSGPRSARRPRPASMAATGGAGPRAFGRYRMPPTPRPAPMRRATCSTAKPPRRRSARR